jgi:hypothetical protein
MNQFGATLPGTASHDSRLTQSEASAAGRTSICVDFVKPLKIDHDFLF